MIVGNSELEDKFEHVSEIKEDLTQSEQIIEIIKKEKKIFRQVLAERLKIDPRNLNRLIKPFLDSGEIGKGKQGRDRFYYYIGKDTISSEISEKVEVDAQPLKLIPSGAKYKRDLIYELLKRERREMHRLEIAKALNLNPSNIDRSFAWLVRANLIVKRMQGKFSYYRLPDTPFDKKKLNFITTLEVYIERIPQLKEFLKYHRHTLRHSDRTIDDYAREIIYFYRYLAKSLEDEKRFFVFPLEQITIKHYTDYIAFLTNEKNYSDNALKSAQTALKSYFRDCKILKFIPENILEGIRAIQVEAKRGIDINQSEFKQMIKSAKDYVDKVLLIVMFDTGARVSEIERIELGDIFFETRKMVIKRSKKRGRIVAEPIDVANETLEWIRRYITEFRPEPLETNENALFIAEKGRRRMRQRYMSNMVRKVRKLVGIKRDVTAHSMRRACARYLWERGTFIEVIMKRLGHTNQATTWGYINETEFFLEEQYRIAQTVKSENETRELMSVLFSDI